MARHPLVAHRNLDDVVAYRRGMPVTVARFLMDVDRIAARLPAGRHVLNACADRYRFAVGLAAAIVAEKVSVLPASLAPETVRRLRDLHADLVCLTDTGHPQLELPRVVYEDAPKLEEPIRPIAMPDIDGERAVAWLFTSGSTGEPVRHLKSWGALVASVGIEADRFALRGDGGETVCGSTIVATVPPQHSYGFESSVLLAWQAPCAFSAARPFYPADVRAALEEVPPPRVLVTTPFHLGLLMESGVTVPQIDCVISATAPLSAALTEEVESRLQTKLFEIFGSTDTGQIASRRPSQGAAWHLFNGVGLATRDGHTWAAGGHVGAPAMLNDVVEMEDDAHFRLLGRSSDLVNVAGKRSSLAFLTHQLTTIPGVRDGAYFMPDEAGSGRVVTRLAAVVVAPALSAVEINRALRARVDPAFLPRPLVFAHQLPRNATGKVTREALAQLIASRQRPTRRPGEALGWKESTLQIAPDHPAFAGHFPGSPIVPGATLLDEALLVIERATGLAHRHIAWVKFLRPVGPGQHLVIRHDVEPGGRLRFEILAGADKIAAGSLAMAAAH
jgi:acyl-coenzyme A synthetase/AMP-(fatty) acid ligase/3-hydroxymyristoyl/3-hydroxydecanoyl-(acyl carrier protein) dehydratase